MVSRYSFSISRSAGTSPFGGMVRAMPTSMSRSVGSSPSGQGSAPGGHGLSRVPVAACQRSRAIFASCRAASPSTATIRSWNGG